MMGLFAVHMSPPGPSCHFAVTQQCSRFRSEADIQRAALTEPDYEYVNLIFYEPFFQHAFM